MRFVRSGVLAVVVTAALAVACGGGGGGGSSSPDAGVGTSSPDGGVSGPDAGTGAPDAGPADTGGTGGGSGGTPDGGGGTATDGGTGGAADGGTAGGGGAADGGVANADPCDGLLPTFGTAFEVRFDPGSHFACNAATSNPSGQVTLGLAGAGSVGVEAVMLPFTATGTPDGVAMDALQSFVGGFSGIDPWFHWTSSGYQGVVHGGNPFSLTLRTWDTHGRNPRDLGQIVTSSAPDGQGGSVVMAQAVDRDGHASGPPMLTWVDAGGAIRRAVAIDGTGDVLVNWPTGHVVVMANRTTDAAGHTTPARARWFDGNGAALTGWFELPIQTVISTWHLLVDGRVAVADAGVWKLTLADGVEGTSDAPAWLASRPSTFVATIRQGRGYAVHPVAQADETHFDVVAATGESCGTVTIPAPSMADGITRAPFRIDVGQDGTLFHAMNLLPPPGGELGLGVHCAFRWWPALLR